jgi:hypothetical protein
VAESKNYKHLKSIKPGEMVCEPGTPTAGPNDHVPLFPKGQDTVAPYGQANVAPSMADEPRNKGGDIRNYDPPKNKD